MVVVALLSVDLVESVDLVSVDLVVNCIHNVQLYIEEKCTQFWPNFPEFCEKAALVNLFHHLFVAWLNCWQAVNRLS